METLTTKPPDRLLDTLMTLLETPSVTREEDQINELLFSWMQEVGLQPERDATGNLFGRLPGEGAPLILSGHMDTVEAVRGVRPRFDGDLVTSSGDTALGADDKAGLAVIFEVVRRLREDGARHRAIDVAISIGEERGLVGAQAMDMTRFTPGAQALVLDSGGPAGVIITGAPGQNSIEATVQGRESHAGVSPERGISAITVAARAIARMPLGRIDEETTANIGVIQGGSARNIVPGRCHIVAEARSHDPAKLESQTVAMTAALQQAATEAGAHVDISVTTEYQAYQLREDGLVADLRRATEAAGVAPIMRRTGGGSDANVFNTRGIEAAVISTGMEDPHAVTERVALSQLGRCVDIVFALVRRESSG